MDRQTAVDRSGIGWMVNVIGETESLSTRTMDRWRMSSGESERGLAVEQEGCACGGDQAAATTIIAQPPCWKHNGAIPRRGQSTPAAVSITASGRECRYPVGNLTDDPGRRETPSR